MFQNCGPGRHLLPLEAYDEKVQNPLNILHISSRNSLKYARLGHWTQKEKLKYTIFLICFKRIMQDPLKIKKIKIFDMLSDMIVTRNADQCRNHHKKMMKKYQLSLSFIIASTAQGYQPRIFSEITEKYSVFIKTLLYNLEIYLRTPNSQGLFQNEIERHAVLSKQVHLRFANQVQIRENYNHTETKNHLNYLQLLKKIDGGIKTSTKTKTQLSEANQTFEKSQTDEIPFMRICEENFQEDESNHENQANICKLSAQDLFQKPGSLKLSKRGRMIYKNEEKKIIFKRQLHTMNIHRLSYQLIKEKQSIKYCDSALKLLRMTLKIAENDV